jgi:LuxR family transcriptional regulator, maltose regulon positive regulatory protein
MIELLRTKIFIPRPRKNLVARSHLVNFLNEGLDKKLTLISAPAGFGKTTVLSEWIPQSPRCVTWLSVDGDDNDPARFWAYFIASLQNLSSQLGENALALLQSTPSFPLTSALSVLINDIVAFQDTFAIVLDDYHLIDSQPIHESLTFLMDHLPANMHLIMTTRVDPPLPIARMRARDTLTEIRAHDLRFTMEEVEAFVSQVVERSLSTEQVAALNVRTEGWIAGLQIAALSLQGHADIPGFIEAFSGSHRHILGYLAEEVINQQPKDTLDFLLQTSILDRLSGTLCDAVTGNSDGQFMLENVEHANLFIDGLDDQREWYRYHHLFAEVLRTRLQQAQPHLIPELHRRASLWYEQNHLWTESINHVLLIPDYERAGDLIERIGLKVALRGQALAVFRWLNALPDESVRARPRLSVLCAWLLLSFSDFENAQIHLDAAEKALQFQPSDRISPELRNIRGEMWATKAMQAVYRRGFDPSQLIDWAEQALQDLHSDNTPFRGTAIGVLGTAYRNQRDWTRAEQAFAQGASMDRATQNAMAVFAAAMQQTLIQRVRGAIDLAIATSRETLDWAAKAGIESSPVTGGLYSNLADLLRERNELETAGRFAKEGLVRSAQTGNPHQHIVSVLILARVKQAMGDFEGALEAILQAQELAQQNQALWFLNLLPAIKAQFHLAKGDLPNALQRLPEVEANAEERRDFVGSYELVYAYEIGQIAALQLKIAQGRITHDPSLLHQVIAQLDEQIQDEESAELLWFRARLQALQAMAYDELGDGVRASGCIEQALTLAAPQGYVRLFIDEGDALRHPLTNFQSILEQRLRADPGHSSLSLLIYTNKLLSAFPQASSTEQGGNENLPEPLSKRELDVLRLIASGHSNQEIAELLVITLSTVKTHINRLYSKLGVKRRTEAILRARELGLISD